MFRSKIFPILDKSEYLDNLLVDSDIHQVTEVECKEDPVYGNGTYKTNCIAVGVVPNLISLCTPASFMADENYRIDAESIGVKAVLVKTSDGDVKLVSLSDNPEITHSWGTLEKETGKIYALRGMLIDPRTEVIREENLITIHESLIPVDVSFNSQTQSLTVNECTRSDIKVIGVELDLYLMSSYN